MFLTSRKILCIALAVAVFSQMAMVSPRDAAAGPYHRRGFHRPGHRVARLPHGCRHLAIGAALYFFSAGIFYQHARSSGYVVVRAPVGAVVSALPPGVILVKRGARVYYEYNDAWYRRVPSGYLVVETPSVPAPGYNPAAPVEPPQTAGGEVSVTTHTLNVRSGPSVQHPVTEHVHRGDVLVISGASGEWFYVKLPSGRFGWVMRQFTTRTFPRPEG
ncbi:SH3 domain-containing protein [Desulfonema ishimotonii]|uniref:SH3 domain-containing protein n=1 Tax=Desulfonema ishimotonii TaxID=45657 RepID=A0A401G4P0_9BACT|nr:DUF6515 family protein [Desulfonema ishimotonii]GBC64105.1 SH3 domain-containing protein [Desulfonema ishimotonii]